MRKKRKKSLPAKQLITVSDPRSHVTEAFRTLRTNIQFSGLDKPVTTILVAGPTPETGKTAVTANLGVTLAQAGAATLLIDTDLRKPTLHRLFNFSSEPGLTNLLIDESAIFKTVVYKSRIEKLHVLACGPIPPNPAELLATEKMKELVIKLREKYDYIIFDSPPINACTDAAVLSRLVDAVLLVLYYGAVDREAATFALEQLKNVQANVIGAILNAVPSKKGGYYYYYHYDEQKTERKPARRIKRDRSTPIRV